MRKSRSCAGALGNNPHIIIAGAGAIGCFVGGLLVAAGHNVTLLARPRISHEIRAHGLALTSFDGMAQRVDADGMTLSDKATCLADADIILVTVKSKDTAIMARTIADHAAPNAHVVSLQNGTENADALRAALPQMDVRAGMVPFNVVPMGQGGFHRATSGDIIIEGGAGEVGAALSVPHLSMTESADITRLQWGKFLINLNNAFNALSGLTLPEQLRDREWRKLMADQWVEAHQVLKANGIKPLSTTPVRVGFIPMILRLPTPLFTRIAASMLTIDVQARTSMSHDLMARRKTEVDALQGLVVRMGTKVGHPTPISTMVVDVVKLAETAKEGLPHLPVRALRREI
ncbi:MAG: 2-dehydropantoate 2-reductase [Sulfitobacter sp.]